MELLRFITCGSVDDGKSTLIGRLLYDSKTLLRDQVAALERSSAKGGNGLNLALLTDGLRAEREQGITIDVAYKYFATPPPHVHHCRHTRARAVHAQHGHRGLDGRFGRPAGGCAARACWSKRAGTPIWPACCASRMWCWR